MPVPPGMDCDAREYDDDYVAAVCFSAEGVDRTLIHAMLELSVAERLAQVEQWAAAIGALRDADEAARAR